jgi:uncharacterized protein YciW
MDDVISECAGISSGSWLASLRSIREDLKDHSQALHDALFRSRDDKDVPILMRAQIAQAVAVLNRCAPLTRYYQEMQDGQPALSPSEEARLAVALAHARTMARSPVAGTQESLNTLADAGFTTHGIVVISQIVALVSYQVRVILGFQLAIEFNGDR